MGNQVSNPEYSASVMKFIVHFIEILMRPPVQPLDLTRTAQIEHEPPEVLIERARKELGINSVKDYNFAVVGASGVGKSSFVNGVRLLEDDSDAAPVGEMECTDEIKRYSHPLLGHVVLWDLPGAGTPKHPASTYFSDKKLYAFDCILILSSDRFLKVDFEIAKLALAYQKRCAFVRTKTDLAVKSIAERRGLTAEEASKQLQEAVEASFREGLKLAGIPQKSNTLELFFVSNKAFSDPAAYHIMDEATKKLDTSLEKMDEDKIYNFLSSSVRSRTMRSLPIKSSSIPSAQPRQSVQV